MSNNQEPKRRGRRKTYALDQSPFYTLESKDRLSEILQFPLHALQDLAARNDGYKVFTLPETKDLAGRTKKARVVQEPKKDLAKIHRRIYVLLARITAPDYLHSAVRKKSYISNAKAHVGPEKTVKVDLRSFYPSTKRHHVFGFFHQRMKCSEDVAALVARLCTWNGILPTGSPISTHLSYFAHSRMFDELAVLAQERNLKFSIYVDDLVFTGPDANTALIDTVEAVIHRHQLSIRRDKSKVYRAGVPKVITGVVVGPEGVRVPFERHKKIRILEEALMRKKGLLQRLPILESLVGLLGEASQIEPRFRAKLMKHAVNLEQARQFKQSQMRVGKPKEGSSGSGVTIP